MRISASSLALGRLSRIEADGRVGLPAEYAEHHGGGEVAVRNRKRVDGLLLRSRQSGSGRARQLAEHRRLPCAPERSQRCDSWVQPARSGLLRLRHRVADQDGCRRQGDFLAGIRLPGDASCLRVAVREFEPRVAGAGGENALVFDADLAGFYRTICDSATARRWTISFLPSSVVKAPGQGWKPRHRL